MAAQPITLTDAQLRHAWQHRRRPDWPAAYEACMAHPMYGRLVRAQAMGDVQAQRQHQAGHAAPPAADTHSLARLPHLRAGAFDPRRAAANDRDD